MYACTCISVYIYIYIYIHFTVILRAVTRDMLFVTRTIRGFEPVLFSTNSQTFPVSRSISLSLSSLFPSFLFSFVSLFISVSLRLFHLFFSSLCFCVAWSVLCCAVLCRVVLCCAMVCCCVLLYLCVVVSCVWTWTVCSREAKKWRTRQRVVLDLFSNWKKVSSMGFFVEPLTHVITLRGQILVSRTDDDPPFSLLPCVRSKRLRVYRHHTHMCLHVWTCCRYTRGRFGCTHGGF